MPEKQREKIFITLQVEMEMMSSITCFVMLSPNIVAHSDIYKEKQAFKIGRDPKNQLDHTLHATEKDMESQNASLTPCNRLPRGNHMCYLKAHVVLIWGGPLISTRYYAYSLGITPVENNYYRNVALVLILLTLNKNDVDSILFTANFF